MRTATLTTQPDRSQRLFPSGLKLTATLLPRRFSVFANRPADPASRAAETATVARP